jgi:hypothetical protein
MCSEPRRQTHDIVVANRVCSTGRVLTSTGEATLWNSAVLLELSGEPMSSIGQYVVGTFKR